MPKRASPKAKSIHTKLLTEISNYVDPRVNQHQYDQILNRLRDLLKPIEQKQSKNIMEILECLEKRGHIAVGNYSVIRDRLNEFDVELGAMIDDAVEEINKIESQNDVSSSDSSLGDKGGASPKKRPKLVDHVGGASPKKRSKLVDLVGGASPKKRSKLEDHEGGASPKKRSKLVDHEGVASPKKRSKLVDHGGSASLKKRSKLVDHVGGASPKKRSKLVDHVGGASPKKRSKLDLKFEFELCEDFTKQEVIHKLEEYKKDLSSKRTAKGYYCFFIVMMGHGKEGCICFCKDKEINKRLNSQEHILTADDDNNTYIEFDTVFSCFKNDKIKEFAEYYHRPFEIKFTLSLIFPIQVLTFFGKPRVFLIQSCRGAVTQTTVDLPDEPPEDEIPPPEDNVEKITIPIDSDTLIAHATTPVMPKNPSSGICLFLREMRKLGLWDSYEEDHLEEMLISVREKVAYGKHYRTNTGGCQMPCVWTTLTKRLFLEKP
ncbi:hypothetical protein KUTeg_022129 [Tegillarca granosa]|uniref:Caspase family p20 domain-containing protein n=1 Tax=Tegillarca granosa TaxID=220873 RepID=A0ABQ9EAS1_TEGGR|nr:hypothetical protein KUTeg_022129 [Tegillarca granosa]